MDLTPEQVEKLKGTNLGKLKDLVEATVDDYLKGLGGMRLPGTRARKSMLEAKTLTLAVRKELLEARPKKGD